MLWASKLFTSEKYRDHINPYLQTVNTMFRLVIVNVHIPRDLKIVQYPKRQKNCISLRGMSFYVSGQQNIPHVNVRSTSVVMSVLTNFLTRNAKLILKNAAKFPFLNSNQCFYVSKPRNNIDKWCISVSKWTLNYISVSIPHYQHCAYYANITITAKFFSHL